MLVVVRASFERDEEGDVLREGKRGREGGRVKDVPVAALEII